MRGIWSGDEDLGDGSLQALCNEYKASCALVKGIDTPGRSRVGKGLCRSLLAEAKFLSSAMYSSAWFLG